VSHALPHRYAVRNFDAGALLEAFLVSAVGSFLAIRFYLELTGYPQVGGHGLHIAHMLWGGLLMLIAVVLMLSFLGKRVRHAGAIIAGLGFGAFIDELGKFITSDNNYFFRPSIAIIYIIFVLLFLVFRAIEGARTPSTEEYLANAIDIMREGVVRKLDDDQKSRAMAYLDQAGGRGAVVQTLQSVLAQIDAVANPKLSWLARGIDGLRRFYLSLARTDWYARVLIVFFAVYVLSEISSLIGVVIHDPAFQPSDWAISFADLGMAVSSAAAAGLFAIGLLRLRRSRLDAYHWFKRAVLVSIFFIEVFAFYSEQLVALAGLVRDVLILVALNYMIVKEQSRTEDGRTFDAPARGAQRAPLPESGS
jgi:hypothetical protein